MIVARASSSGNGNPYRSTVATNLSTPPSIFWYPWYASIGPITSRTASRAAPDGNAPLTNGKRIGPNCTALSLQCRGPRSRLGVPCQLPSPAVPIPNPTLRLGSRRYDVTNRCLVMGIVDCTPDPSYDQGATFALDRTLRRADALVADGVDILDVGVNAGSDSPVAEHEEIDRVVPVVRAIASRFDVAVSARTRNARVLAAACAAGAVMGNDRSGFGDPGYLASAAVAGASVVATHPGLNPVAGGPEPHDEGLVAEVAAFLADRVERAVAAGLVPEKIVLDAGLDLGKTAAQSAVLLRESDRLASLGCPLLLSTSNVFLDVLPDFAADARRARSLAAVAYGVTHGCRIVRVHDVAGTVRVVRVIERILVARAEAEPHQPGSRRA
jgi:dihydropteroate synthase